MNAELRRYVWTELTPQRVGVAAAVVAGGLIAAGGWDGPDGVLNLGGAVFALALLWATLQAANALSSEVAARSWDGQRLSAMSAEGLVFGKFVGAGLLPSLVAIAAAGAVAWAAFEADGEAPSRTLLVLLGALFCAQAVALFLDASGVARGGGDARSAFGGAARAVAALALTIGGRARARR